MTEPAELRSLRQWAYDLAAHIQAAHEHAAAGLDPATEDPLQRTMHTRAMLLWHLDSADQSRIKESPDARNTCYED
jgi:hypothetical protein